MIAAKGLDKRSPKKSFRLAIAFPPPITENAKNSKGHEGKIKDPPIQSLSRPFALLLCSAGADGALS